MEVIAYQIVIIIIIIIAGGIFGKSIRDKLIFVISIFTFFMIFKTWLIILQFISIYIGYSISQDLLSKKKTTYYNENNYPEFLYSPKKKLNEQTNWGKILLTLFILGCSIYFASYVWINKQNKNIQNENVEKEPDTNTDTTTTTDYNSNSYDSYENITVIDSVDQKLKYDVSDNVNVGSFKNIFYEHSDEIYSNLEILSINDDGFYFKLTMISEYFNGSIDDFAEFNSDNTATYEGSDCIALNFEFYSYEKINIIQTSCEYDSSNTIIFDKVN